MPKARNPEERAAKLALARASGRSAQPAKPGDKIALQHGAYSSDVVQPLVEARLTAWLADKDFPEYAKALPQRFTLRSLARVEVRLDLLYARVEEMELDESLSELQETHETVRGGGDNGPLKRNAKQTKRRDLDDAIRRWETLRLNISKELGLTPMAQTKMGRNVAATTVDLAQLIQQENENGAALEDEGEIS